MTGPMVLVPAGVIALTAMFCAGRLVWAPLGHHPSEPGVDALHLVMGAVMVAMLLGVLSPQWETALVVGFLAATLWFLRAALVESVRDLTGGPARHHLQHSAGCLAMLVMLVGASPYAGSGAQVLGGGPVMPAVQGLPGMSGMGMVSGGVGPSGLLVVALAVTVIGLAVLDTALIGRAGAAAWAGGRRVLAPRCAAGCRIAMSLTMGAVLLAMH